MPKSTPLLFNSQMARAVLNSITDADLDREARDFAAYGDLKEAAREVIRSQVDPVEDRTAAIEKLARLVGSE